jgi:hypothetical protein
MKAGNDGPPGGRGTGPANERKLSQDAVWRGGCLALPEESVSASAKHFIDITVEILASDRGFDLRTVREGGVHTGIGLR